jgi:DNA integrity scanning protein DisA with diadenylate cyclase activity
LEVGRPCSSECRPVRISELIISTELPQKPDFAAIEAAAPHSASRRTFIMALIGNLTYAWSNNESMFIYVLMLLMVVDQTIAAIVFATLNTTRARLDLIERLAKVKIRDKAVFKDLMKIIARFNELTRLRNEFNHCLYRVNEQGEITHTQSIRLLEVADGLQFGTAREMDDARTEEISEAIRKMTKLNRDIWNFLPILEGHLNRQSSPNGAPI